MATTPGLPRAVDGGNGKLADSHQETDKMIITAIIASLAIATAPEKQDPSAYPELAQEKLLPAIIADLRRTLPDPYSVRDLIVCPARQIKIKDGRPVSWVVSFALNAKNAAGGYTGLRSYVVGFKNGQINLHASSTSMPGADAFDAMINRAIMKRFETCPSIPNDKLQALLSAPITDQ